MGEQLRAVVYGRVQVVMYRDFAQRKARRLGLTGEVRNLPDGTVSVVAEGTHVLLEQFLQKLKRGPLLAWVSRVDASWHPATQSYKTFRIRYD